MKNDQVAEIVKYKNEFSEPKFIDKVKGIAVKVGEKVIYPAVLLYNMYKSDSVSLKDKAIVIGALGYFILPTDMVSDLLPIMGFTDDVAVMTLAIRSLSKSITSDLRKLTSQKVKEILNAKRDVCDSDDMSVNEGNDIVD